MQGYGEGKKEQSSVGVEKKLKSGGVKIRDVIQIVLRLAAVGGSIGAASLMFTAHQTALVYDVPMDAKYSYTSAFKFYAFANAIASVFAVISLGLTLILRKHGNEGSNHHFFFFLHDLGVMAFLLAACSAATAIGYVGQYGNSHAGWVPICDHFKSFCHRIIASVALGFFSFFSFLFLTILSATNYAAAARFTSGQVRNGF